jgi:hypothetical protein
VIFEFGVKLPLICKECKSLQVCGEPCTTRLTIRQRERLKFDLSDHLSEKRVERDTVLSVLLKGNVGFFMKGKCALGPFLKCFGD